MTLFGEHPRRNGSDVTWHFAPLDESEIVEREGMRVTSLDRTVYDVIRTESLETAVACFDAALRLAGGDETTNEYDCQSVSAASRKDEEVLAGAF